MNNDLQNKTIEEFRKKFRNIYAGDSGFGGNDPQEPMNEWATDCPEDVESFLKLSLQQAFKEYGERVIGEDSGHKCKKHKDCFEYNGIQAIKNKLRREQRKKLKEI